MYESGPTSTSRLWNTITVNFSGMTCLGVSPHLGHRRDHVLVPLQKSVLAVCSDGTRLHY